MFDYFVEVAAVVVVAAEVVGQFEHLVIKKNIFMMTKKKKQLTTLLEIDWAARTLFTCCCKKDVANGVAIAILLVITGPLSIV